MAGPWSALLLFFSLALLIGACRAVLVGDPWSWWPMAIGAFVLLAIAWGAIRQVEDGE